MTQKSDIPREINQKYAANQKDKHLSAELLTQLKNKQFEMMKKR